jgi:hypothetical protein
MAHFAQLNDNNEVINVIVVNNDVIAHPMTRKESENIGIRFCKSVLGAETRWVQTSYHNNFRGIFAGIGLFYDPEKDVFFDPDNEDLQEEMGKWLAQEDEPTEE